MQKNFYASGFLYNLKTRQILLLKPAQQDDSLTKWSMFGGEGQEGEDAPMAFGRIVKELLDLELKTKQICPVYDYFHEAMDKFNYVFYAEVKKPLDETKLNNLSWVTFQETLKLVFSSHTKQDVIVGERVIRLKERQIAEGLTAILNPVEVI